MWKTKKNIGRPRKPPRVKFCSDLRPEDADLLKAKEREGMRKNAVLDQALDAYRVSGGLLSSLASNCDIVIFGSPQKQSDADEPRYKVEVIGPERVMKQLIAVLEETVCK